MSVHPARIGEIARRHPAVRHARLVIERLAHTDVMALMIETSASPVLVNTHRILGAVAPIANWDYFSLQLVD
jgi:hypothetical protein